VCVYVSNGSLEGLWGETRLVMRVTSSNYYNKYIKMYWQDVWTQCTPEIPSQGCWCIRVWSYGRHMQKRWRRQDLWIVSLWREKFLWAVLRLMWTEVSEFLQSSVMSYWNRLLCVP